MKRIRRPRPITPATHESDFREVLSLIEGARQRAFLAVNAKLIDLYWRVGAFISKKLETAVWGQGVVAELAVHIQRHHPNLRGFTRASLFGMRQFFEAYRQEKKVAALLRQLQWTQHLTRLPDAALLKRKLHEFYRLALPPAGTGLTPAKGKKSPGTG